MQNWSEKLKPQVRNGILVAVVAIVLLNVLYTWIKIPLLSSHVAALSSQSLNMKQEYDRMEGFVMGTEKYNYGALVDISNERKISQEAFISAIYVLENEPYTAGTYLATKLGFTPTEVKAVLNNPVNSSSNTSTSMSQPEKK